MISFGSLIALFIGWATHVDMVKEFTGVCGKGSFNDFLNEVKKHEYTRDRKHIYSHFSQTSQIHASIIQFNHVGMILGFFGYTRFSLWIYRNRYRIVSDKRFKELHKERTEK